MPVDQGVNKKIRVRYYALLREERGLSEECLETSAKTAGEFYDQLKNEHRFRLSTDVLRVAINDEFSEWTTALNDNDTVVFIPPVAGG